jgi:hypothetical protein
LGGGFEFLGDVCLLTMVVVVVVVDQDCVQAEQGGEEAVIGGGQDCTIHTCIQGRSMGRNRNLPEINRGLRFQVFPLPNYHTT